MNTRQTIVMQSSESDNQEAGSFLARDNGEAAAEPLPHFTTKWFHKETQPLWEKYLLPRGPFKDYCEAGVFEAASLLWAFDNLLSPNGHAVGIDSFKPKRKKNTAEMAAVRERCFRNTEAARATGRLNLIERRSQDVFLDWCAAPAIVDFDFIFIDAEHEGVACLEDLVFSWRLLKVGGVLVVDDLDYRWQRRRPRTWEAVTAFEWAYERRFETIYRTRKQVAYLKVQ